MQFNFLALTCSLCDPYHDKEEEEEEEKDEG
jgi:hypothetical protein